MRVREMVFWTCFPRSRTAVKWLMSFRAPEMDCEGRGPALGRFPEVGPEIFTAVDARGPVFRPSFNSARRVADVSLLGGNGKLTVPDVFVVPAGNAPDEGFFASLNSAGRVASVIRLGKTVGLSTPGTFVFFGKVVWPLCPVIAPRLNFRFKTPTNGGPPGQGFVIAISVK